MSIQLLDILCPKCEATCWVNNGNIDDQTLPDIEAIKCWKCTHCFWTLEKEVDYSAEDDWAEKSYKTAKEALNR